jgi:hypothetical protein
MEMEEELKELQAESELFKDRGDAQQLEVEHAREAPKSLEFSFWWSSLFC